MSRHGLTLLELLAASMLSGGLMVGAGAWMLGLQRGAREFHDAVRRSDAAHLAAVRLRQDLLAATTVGTDAALVWLRLAGPGGGAAQRVIWRQDGDRLERTAWPAGGGRPRTEIVADGIDGCSVRMRDRDPVAVEVRAGSARVLLPVLPGMPDGHAP